jgi:hypothetical protein
MRQAGVRHSAFALRARLSGTSPPFRTKSKKDPVLRAFSTCGYEKADRWLTVDPNGRPFVWRVTLAGAVLGYSTIDDGSLR